MKKAILTLLILTAFAAAALGETLTNGEFGFEYPDGWTLDTVSYLSDNDEEYEWLGDFYNDVYWGSSFIETDVSFSDFSLKGASDEERDEWVSARLELLSGYEAEMYADLTSESGVPFILYNLSNEGNRLIEAATCISGSVFVIDLCMYDGGEPDTGCYALLEEMAKSFYVSDSAKAEEEGDGSSYSESPEEPEETVDPMKYTVAV